MATSLSDFLPEVLVEIPEVPDVLAIHHLRNAAISFCEQSTYVRSDISFNTVVDQATYVAGVDFTAPTDHRIVEIYDGRVVDNLNPIKRKTPGQLNTEMGPDWYTETGTTYYVTRETTESVRLVMIPTAIKAVVIPAAWKPIQTATTVDDALYDDWHETIAHGALARIYAIPRKSWSDMNTAMMHANLFGVGIEDAKRRVENAYLKPTRTTSYGGI